MHERPKFLSFCFSSHWVYFSARIFLVVILARLPGPLPACPRRRVAACAQIKTQALFPRWHHPLIVALSVSKYIIETTRAAHP